MQNIEGALYKFTTSSLQSNKNNFQNKKKITSHKEKTYRQLISNWQYCHEKLEMSPQKCFQNFKEQLKEHFSIQIMMDNFLGEVLVDLSKDQKFYQYANTQKHQNKHRKILIQINQQAYKKQFISKRQYLKFNKEMPPLLSMTLEILVQNLKAQNLYSNQNQIQSKMKDYQQKIVKIFQKTLLMSIQKFWNIVLIHRIQQPIIQFVYQKFKNTIKSQRLMKQVKNFMLNWAKSQKIKEKELQEQLSMLSVSQVSIQQLTFKMTHAQVQSQLNQYAQKISLYLFPQICKGFEKQLKQVINFMQINSNQENIQYRVFGSFCNRFALVNSSDIDVVLLFNLGSQDTRYKRFKLLSQINQILQSQGKHYLKHFYDSKVLQFPKLPHPFLKLSYRFGIENIAPSIDFIINNDHGVRNSQLLSIYSKNKYILKFGNLIKKWALKTNLINTKKKIAGLSSYGLIIMVLYFLMKTQQIPFLKIVINESLAQTFDTGKVQKIQFKRTIYQNFLQFTRFYLKFIQNEKQEMVCLLRQHNGKQIYDDNIIVNIYDFIDKTNAGRMKNQLRSKFISIFQSTKQFLKKRERQSFLKILFE